MDVLIYDKYIKYTFISSDLSVKKNKSLSVSYIRFVGIAENNMHY